MSRHVRRLIELLQDVLREDLAELDAHLVKRVDAPHDTLREDLVLVQHDERAECLRIELREEDAVARAVALEDFGLDQGFGRP